MNITLKLRRGLASEWANTNPVLKEGEPGLERDTGRLKIGDNYTPWNDLPYYVNKPEVEALIAASGGSGSDPRIGDMAQLSTTEKTTVVGAVNEINVPLVPLLDLYNNAKAG